MDPTLPTATALVTKLKSQGFFDKTRKRCLENLESNSDYLNLKGTVDGIVSSFLSDKFAKGSKIELREKLRRRLQEDVSLKYSINHMADLLLSTYASPDSLAPTINQMTCESLNVNYQEWLNMGKNRPLPPPMSLIPDPTTITPLSIITDTTASAPPQSKISGHISTPLLPAPILPIPPIKKEPLLPTTPSDPLITPLIQYPLLVQHHASPSSDFEMEVDDNGDDMEVESSDSNHCDAVKPEPTINSRHADTPHKLANPLLSLDLHDDSKPPPPSFPAILRNSSSFSRKISTSTRAQPASLLLHAGGSLDDISDNEMIDGDVSPLHRRMSMSGNPIKQNSPPSTLNPTKQIFTDGGLERNPSPRLDTYRKASPNRSSGHSHGRKDLHQSDYRNRDGDRNSGRDKVRTGGRDSGRTGGHDTNFRSRRDHYRKGDRHGDTEINTGRSGRHNSNVPPRSGIGLLERQIRNPSPVMGSRSISRDLLSRSQSPPISTRRQRQSSPHSTKTPDSRISHPHKSGKSSDSKDYVRRRQTTGHRDSSRSQDRDKDRHRQDRRKLSPSKHRYDNRDSHHRYRPHQNKLDSDRRSRNHSKESSSSIVRRSSPYKSSTSAPRHQRSLRQVSPKIRLPSLSPPPRRDGNATSPVPPSKTGSRSNGFNL